VRVWRLLPFGVGAGAGFLLNARYLAELAVCIDRQHVVGAAAIQRHDQGAPIGCHGQMRRDDARQGQRLAVDQRQAATAFIDGIGFGCSGGQALVGVDFVDRVQEALAGVHR
jgi:hypothetical protein